jgi:acetyltransferase-like isoleucine patch superfamily enzyme
LPGVSWRAVLARKRRALGQRAVHWAWQAAQRAGAVTADSPAGRKFGAFGAGSILVFPPGAIFGEPWIEVGADTVIGKHVTMSAGTVPGQDLGVGPLLRIGDRCVIGRGTHIVAHEEIKIDDDVYTGPYVYITDQNHGYTDPHVPIGRQWPTNAAVSIGAGSWLGAGAIVLPGAVIGRNVVVAAGSVVRGRVPDHSVVAGVPAKVIRSYVPGDGWRPPRRPDGIPQRLTDLDLAETGLAETGLAQTGLADTGAPAGVAADTAPD